MPTTCFGKHEELSIKYGKFNTFTTLHSYTKARQFWSVRPGVWRLKLLLLTLLAITSVLCYQFMLGANIPTGPLISEFKTG